MSRSRLVALLLALVTLVVYLPVTRHVFVYYDDDDYVVNNQVVRNGLTLSGVKWAFTSFHACNWHPLTWLSHMADCNIFGLNPAGHHFVSVLFHATNTALLFILLLRITKQITPSVVVAALFAWHPLHVESVAWIAERKDVLSACCALLALLSYTRFVQNPEAGSQASDTARPRLLISALRPPSSGYYWLALMFFTLGLLAKPMLVTLPFVMLLLDFWPLQRVTGGGWQVTGILRLVGEKIPFFVLTAASCVVTLIAQRAGHAVVTLDQEPILVRIESSTVSTTWYLLKILWPSDLAVIYPVTKIPVGTFILAAVTLASLSFMVWIARKRNPCWLIGWLWFLGTLVPVIGLVQVGGAAMADRYTYLPSIGIFIAIVFGLHELAGRWPWPRKTFPFCMALPLIACVMLTERQLAYWRDSETLFRHTVAITTDNITAHLVLGAILDLQGRSSEALAEYRTAARIKPAYYPAHFSIGNLLEKLNRPAEALVEYRLCISNNPIVPPLHNAAGGALLALGEFDEALGEFAEAARLDPRYVAPHVGAAKIRLRQGRDRDAINQLRAALRIDPDNFEILAYTAQILAANENPAVRDGQTALALALKANDLTAGKQPLVLDILGMAFAETGDFTNAVSTAQIALELAELAKLKNIEAIRQRLELYKSNQPWRESFRTTNAPGKN